MPTDATLDKIAVDSKFFDSFEQSPLRALLLWHLNSGHAAFRGIQEEDREALLDEILNEKLTPEQRLELVREF